MVAFLLNDAGYITGAVIPVEAGSGWGVSIGRSEEEGD